MQNEPVVVEETYSASIEEVWQAITEIEKMRQWYFDNIPDFKPEVGFETQFLVQAPSRGFQHIWKITEVVPQKRLAYQWTFEGITGRSISIFELFGEGDKTRLRVTATGLETFPKDIPEFKRESCEAGWNYFLGEALKKYFSK